MKLTEQVEHDVRDFLKDVVYKTVVPRNVRLSEAPSHGLPAIIYDLSCPGSLAYIRLAKEVIKRQKKKKVKVNVSRETSAPESELKIKIA